MKPTKPETRNFKIRSSTWIGLGWGLLAGATPFWEPIGTKAQLTLGAGLLLTYLSIGFLLNLIPFPFFVRNTMTKLFWGALFGTLYSLPGAVFTMTPYPLAENAPDYFREFTSGGLRAFTLTLLFGAIVGTTCLLGRRAFRVSE